MRVSPGRQPLSRENRGTLAARPWEWVGGPSRPVWGERVRVVLGVRAGRGRGSVYERLWAA